MEAASRKEFIFAFVLTLLFTLGYAAYAHVGYLKQSEIAARSLASTTAALATSLETVETLQQGIRLLEQNLAEAKNRESNLTQQLADQKTQITKLEAQVKGLGGTIDIFTKITTTDRELLQKYSKVYFLNENYIPASLSQIDSQYIFDETKLLEIHTKVKPYLEQLLAAAAADGQAIQVISGYRSFGTQATLKSSYVVTYGAGTANKFSAEQGYSEHQLGTTVDFTTPSLGVGFSKFETASAYNWLLDHAYEYGFILSYPKNNSYYQFEPWHWRFVGVALATKLHEDKQNFYDRDQRELDAYIGTLFD